MATAARTITTAQQARELSIRVAEIRKDLTSFAAYNTVQNINWNALQAEDAGVDANGLIEGEDYTPADVANAIGSLAAINTEIGDALVNLYKLVPANQQ